MEGSSNTPLLRKLGVKPGDTVWLRHAPLSFSFSAPSGVTVRRRRGAAPDVVFAFYTRSSALDREIEELARAVFPSASLWVAWPKGTSGVATDLSDQVVRATALPLGLVDNKVCAIDDTWSGLRLVWRVSRRGTAPPVVRP